MALKWVRERRRDCRGYTFIMKMNGFAFGTTEWTAVTPTEHAGESGVALWRTQHFGEIRVRIVEYSAGYKADHWCTKGHVILCLEGVLETEIADGRRFTLKAAKVIRLRMVNLDTAPRPGRALGCLLLTEDLGRVQGRSPGFFHEPR